MSTPVNQRPVSGIDASARAQLDNRPVAGVSDAQDWFASEMITPGSIGLPNALAGSGTQDLDRLVDGILAPIGG